MICAFPMTPLLAVLAAGLGSMLADLLAGYVGYAFGTLVIKAGMTLIASLVYRRCGKAKSPRQAFMVMTIAGILAETFMVPGYFDHEAIFLGMGMNAVGAVAGNTGQGVAGAIIACVISPVLMKYREVMEMMKRS